MLAWSIASTNVGPLDSWAKNKPRSTPKTFVPSFHGDTQRVCTYLVTYRTYIAQPRPL